MDDRQRRIARGRLLRRQGKTYDEIRAALDYSVSDDTLRAWVRGIPRPSRTFRGRAKDELRSECRRLRAEGYSYRQIAVMTGASKGSISPWVHDVVIPPGVARVRDDRARETRLRTSQALAARAEAKREEIRRAAASRMPRVDGRDLFMVGLALYWAEGTKDKPWRRKGRVIFVNSDPTVIRTFLAWLDLLGIAAGERGYRLTIHETADVSAQETWWAETLRLPLSGFSRATLKRHNPKTVRRNTGVDYHGCLVVTVARSSALYYAVEGWWQTLSEDAQRAAMVHTGRAVGPP